jgi:hypothetical protein
MKKYQDGGSIEDGKKNSRANYGKDVVDFVLKNQSPANRKNFKDIELKDVPGMMKEYAATTVGTAALPFADVASAVVNAGRDGLTGINKKLISGTKSLQESTARLKKMRGQDQNTTSDSDLKKGGAVKMAKGGSASSRADGCAVRGKTKGMMR